MEAAACGKNNTELWQVDSIVSPSMYGPNLDCFWILKVSIGNLIKVSYGSFEVSI